MEGTHKEHRGDVERDIVGNMAEGHGRRRSMPEEVWESIRAEGTVVVATHATAKTPLRGCSPWATHTKVGKSPKRLQYMEEPMPEPRKTNKEQGAARGYCYAHDPNFLYCLHLIKGIERVWVKPVAKIRAAETRKRRKKKTCQQFLPATRGEQGRTVKNVKEAGKKVSQNSCIKLLIFC